MIAAIQARHGARIAEIWRYYRAGLLNTAFGFGLFSLLVWAGLNIFVAQIVAHILGVAFNYITLSRLVFRNVRGATMPYIAAYAVNYGVSAAFLLLFHRLGASDYIAGALAILAASVINYVILKRFVFRPDSG